MKRIAIIGGGIAGLSAAYRAQQLAEGSDPLSYTLFERSHRLGGVIRTERLDDCIAEAGPDSFLTEKPAGAELCRELGLADELIGSNDTARKTCIVVRGRLTPLPDGLQFMVPTRVLPAATSRLFSLGTKLRFAREYIAPPRAPHSGVDESVADLVRRHFGQEVVDRLADPLLAGIYGGSATRLSARAVLPRMVDMEAREGSLIRGMLTARSRMPASTAPRSLFTTLRGGMQQMVDALGARLDRRNVRLESPIASLARTSTGWRIATSAGNSDEFDAVVLAAPARAAGELLASLHPGLGAELSSITYTSSITVALTFDEQVLGGAARQGFGFLVPRTENLSLLACTYVHNKFANRAPAGRALLRCFVGAERAERMMVFADDQIVRQVCDDLRNVLGIAGAPRASAAFRGPQAMAQYEVGHLERVARIEKMRRELPCLALAGNYLRGIGVPDCIQSGAAALIDVVQSLDVARSAQPQPGARV